MFHIVLYQPEIPPNTGNIIRLCANSNSRLHLIEPLGFELDHQKLRRAGLDYHEYTSVGLYPDLAAFQNEVQPNRILACSTKGKCKYSDVNFQEHDALLFGPETRGLPSDILQTFPEQDVLCIPMANHSRSLNLSNTVAIVLYEALRQHNFNYTK